MRLSYLEYLERCTGKVFKGRLYYNLLEALYHTEFYSSVEMDINRVHDTRALRDEYITSYRDDPNIRTIPGDVYRQPTNVLEILLSLSDRIDNIVDVGIYNNDEDILNYWFWKMIENVGLDELDDVNWDTDKYDEIIHRWLNRSYGRDGKGGLFPLKNPSKNQKHVELWYQMQEYLIENYDL